MNLILQPEGSYLCGQTCVAMIAGVTLEKSIAIFGKRSGTSTKDVVRALRALGVDCGDGLILARTHKRPPLCMAVLHFDGIWQTHWTIWNGDHFVDPSIGLVAEYGEGVRVTSYLPIFRTEETKT